MASPHPGRGHRRASTGRWMRWAPAPARSRSPRSTGCRAASSCRPASPPLNRPNRPSPALQGQRSAVSGSGWVVVGGALAACLKTAAVTPPGGLSR